LRQVLPATSIESGTVAEDHQHPAPVEPFARGSRAATTAEAADP
jgi:hypothetical protein